MHCLTFSFKDGKCQLTPLLNFFTAPTYRLNPLGTYLPTFLTATDLNSLSLSLSQKLITTTVSRKWVSSSVTRWQNYFSIFAHLQQFKFATNIFFAKEGSKLWLAQNKHWNVNQRFVEIIAKAANFAKSGRTVEQEKISWMHFRRFFPLCECHS